MNKWLKIGAIAGAAALGVVVLGLAAFVALQPGRVSAQVAPRLMQEARGAERFGRFEADFGRRGQFEHPGGPGRFGGQIDFDALLADALGITVEELEAAYDQAHTAAVQQALDEGLVTQEEADMMLARMQLKDYLDRDELTAKALGITTDELQAAYDEGKPLAVLIYELGLDRTTLRTNMQTAFDEALQQAVADGVITQAQADQLQDGPGFGAGPRGMGGPRVPGGFGGRGGFGGK